MIPISIYLSLQRYGGTPVLLLYRQAVVTPGSLPGGRQVSSSAATAVADMR